MTTLEMRLKLGFPGSVVVCPPQRAVVLRVHGALVGGARGGPGGALAGGARHVPGVPRALLPAGRVPGAPARLLTRAPSARVSHVHRRCL